ncbi:hypothetical protein PtA15_16A38 [Puccinia triticina]|uniref:Secreted protein n=1 Tax=Puccinia triticina TaxID=208348 RepID=A0ABY7D778_9BASI|nr:uncharacterized protein PtA15_16A38 [Puccinia triticina]WAQ92132.1 hypothetical protein PtA15_16A38 [Puccinia triticina]
MNHPFLRNITWLAWTSLFVLVSGTEANWDEATGHIRDHKPTEEWLSMNSASAMTSNIQVSECARNTRLAYPKVQLFAYFEVNHGDDCYHGCPYGNCHAFTNFPQPDDLEPSYTDGHSFFWHKLGGHPGSGVKPISNPRNGAYGWEDSINGRYYDGKPDYSRKQNDHDEHYPLWSQRKTALTPWPADAAQRFENGEPEPYHPKCGRPCEPNKDPGSVPGAYGNYHSTPASEYFPPKDWEGSCDDSNYSSGPNHKPDRINSTSRSRLLSENEILT